MLDWLIPELRNIWPPIEDLETKTGFPSWVVLCKVWEQTTKILQYTQRIEEYLWEWAIIDPKKCNTTMFQTDYWDFWWCYHYIKSESWANHSELYNDAQYFFALDYDWLTIAYVWFNLDENWNSEIVQIQWAKLVWKNFSQKIEHNWFLKNFKWKEYLVSELVAFLKKNSIWNKLKIQSAKNNSWLEVSSHANRIPWWRWYKTYDQVAKDLWFKWDSQNWYILEL